MARKLGPHAQPPYSAWQLDGDETGEDGWGIRSSTGVNCLGSLHPTKPGECFGTKELVLSILNDMGKPMADRVSLEEALEALQMLLDTQPSESPIWECDRWQGAVDAATDVLSRARAPQWPIQGQANDRTGSIERCPNLSDDGTHRFEITDLNGTPDEIRCPHCTETWKPEGVGQSLDPL